jgi:hypothetical protein
MYSWRTHVLFCGMLKGKRKPQDLHRRSKAGGRYLGNYETILVELTPHVKTRRLVTN